MSSNALRRRACDIESVLICTGGSDVSRPGAAYAVGDLVVRVGAGRRGGRAVGAAGATPPGGGVAGGAAGEMNRWVGAGKFCGKGGPR